MIRLAVRPMLRAVAWPAAGAFVVVCATAAPATTPAPGDLTGDWVLQPLVVHQHCYTLRRTGRLSLRRHRRGGFVGAGTVATDYVPTNAAGCAWIPTAVRDKVQWRILPGRSTRVRVPWFPKPLARWWDAIVTRSAARQPYAAQIWWFSKDGLNVWDPRFARPIRLTRPGKPKK